MPANYTYDVFISYSSADRPWAVKLYETLKERGLEPFLDQRSLEAGKPWEPTLAKAVQAAQHLLVLWSGHAEKSSWVRRELGLFENIVDPNTGGPNTDGRRFLFVMLEGDNPAYASMQMISDIKDANAYAGGVAGLTSDRWQIVVQKIADAIHADDPSIPLPFVVLTMTRQELAELDLDEVQEFGPAVSTLLHDIGIGTIETLAQCYGEQRTDWRPFGSKDNVHEVLEKLLATINKDISERENPPPPFRWAPVASSFWTDLKSAQDELPRLLSSHSVIVIDPLALYHERVFQRLVLLSKCFERERCTILVLTPFLTPPMFTSLSALVEQRGYPFFNVYYTPPVPLISGSATLGLNISDERDMRRLLRSSLGQHLRIKESPVASPYLKQ